jgi:hypothetical protein
VSPQPRTYATPAAFKRALEDRLRDEALQTRTSLVRLRQLFVFDRLLGRIDREFSNAAIAKGGVVLELRLERARTTRDLDLRLAGSTAEVLPRLQRAGRLDLGDRLSFEVRELEQGTIDGDGIVYEGFRYRAEAYSPEASMACPSAWTSRSETSSRAQ